MKKVDLHIRVDDDLAEYTKEAAKKDSRSITSWITMLIKKERDK